MATYYIPSISKFPWQMPVIDRLADPPGTPSKGDRYLIIATASGDWTGHEDDITYYDGSSWQFWTPAEGWTVWVDDEDAWYVYDGASWSKIDYQSQGDVLDDLNTLGANAADSEFLVGTGPGALAWESGSTVRSSLGLGTGDTPEFTGLNLGSPTVGVTYQLGVQGGSKNAIAVFEQGSVGAGDVWCLIANSYYSAGSTDETATLYLAPLNAVIGGGLRCYATEDFGSSANRTSGLKFIVRKNGTLKYNAMVLSPDKKLGLGGVTSPSEDIHVGDTIRADTAFNLNGTDGWSGTFTNGDGATVTVSGGIITSVT